MDLKKEGSKENIDTKMRIHNSLHWLPVCKREKERDRQTEEELRERETEEELRERERERLWQKE